MSSNVSEKPLDPKTVENLEKKGWAYVTAKLGNFWGHEVCRVGSPYTIALALLIIGVLSSLQILPLGVQITQTCYTFGLLVFMVTYMRNSQKKETEWIINNLSDVKKTAQPLET